MEFIGTLNPEIKKFLENVCLYNGWIADEQSFAEILIFSKPLNTEFGEPHRWYNEITVVVQVQDKLIQYDWFNAPGDKSIEDMGLAFNFSSVKFCEPYKVEVTKYRPIEQ